MKKVFACLVSFFIFLLTISSATLYPTLPKDIGSNSNIMTILYPEESKIITHAEGYLISCMAPPKTEITLYEKYDDTLYVPLMVNNEAITGVVGESGLYLIDMTFKPKSTNRIMFFAQNGKKYQSEFRTIIVEEKEVEEKVEHRVLDIKSFVMNVQNSVK